MTYEVTIELDEVQVSRTARERPGNRALTRPDLDEDVILGRVHGAHDGIDNTRVRQEVLTEAFPCSVLCHQLATMAAASSTAASKLPGSALP